jgi:hypothetical protein
MFKMSDACCHHRYAVSVAVVGGFLITDGASGLDDGCDACFVGYLYAVAEGEERIAGHHGTFKAEAEGACFLDGLLERIDT